METFSTWLAICAGNSSVTGEFPAQRPVTRGFDVLSDLRLNKRLSKNNLEAGELRRHCAHHDVTVMRYLFRQTRGSGWIWTILEAKSVAPELTTRDSEHCWWSVLLLDSATVNIVQIQIPFKYIDDLSTKSLCVLPVTITLPTINAIGLFS